MSDVKQALALIEAAGRDIAALQGMSDADVFADEIFGFHAQQAAEKLLKAWLALLDEVYPLTHDLELLLAILEEHGVVTKQFEVLVEYTPYAGRIRYESSEPATSPLDRVATLLHIETLAGHVRQLSGSSSTTRSPPRG